MSAAAGAMLYPEPGRVPSVVLAVLVHLLLALFLFFGVRWQSRQSEAVMVELWTSPAVPAVEPAAVQAAPPKPEAKLEKAIEPPRPAVKPEKVIESPKPEIALEKKKETKKEPPKKPDPPKKSEPQKKAEPAKKPEPVLNLDRRKEIRAQAERESAALSTQSEKDSILEQMRREVASTSASADAAYAGKIKGRIRSNIVLPPDIPGNPEAIFDVVQLPTGEIMSVNLRKPSGHKAYDAAVERAILKSSPLPKPDKPEQFQRRLEIKFKPLD